MKSPEDLVLEFEARRAQQTARLAQYEKFINAYFDKPTDRSLQSAMDATGRPTLRGQLNYSTDKRGSPNMLKPIVDDFTALRGIIPLMRTLPGGEGQEAMDLALKQSRVISACWDNSNMPVQWALLAWYLSACGDALLMLDPLLPNASNDLDPAGVYITAYHPKNVFPKHRTGRWAEELSSVFIAWEVDADTAVAEYGIRPTKEFVDVLIQYTPEVKRTIVDGQQAKTGNVEHKLGWVPGQWLRNMLNTSDATADIAQGVDVHDEFRSLVLMQLDAVADAIYSPIVITNPLEVQGDTLTIGPREVLTTTDKGHVSRVAPAPPPQFANELSSVMQNSLYHVTGTTPVRPEGAIAGSNISGRAIHAVQGPQETRMALSQTVMGYHMSKLNQKILLMYGKIPELAKANMTLTGSDRGKPWAVDFTGKEIGGLTRQDIKWDALIGSTRHERLVMALQAYAQNLVPGSYVVAQLGEDDPEAVVKLARDEKMALMASMQQAGVPPEGGAPPGGNPDVMAPAQQGLALAGGSATPLPPGGSAPVQPGPAQPESVHMFPDSQGQGGGMPNFPPQPVAPNAPGSGPPPQAPDVWQMVQTVVAGLDPDTQADIVEQPYIDKSGAIVVPVNSFKHSANIKRAFRMFGLRAKTKATGELITPSNRINMTNNLPRGKK